MFLTLFVALAEVFVPVVSQSRGSFPMKMFCRVSKFELGRWSGGQI